MHVFNVGILEVEWLQDKKDIEKFFEIVVKEDTHFDNELVQHLLDELDYWYPLFITIFLPFLAYFCMVTFYNCFILTDANEARDGFLHGSYLARALRVLIFITTVYQFFIEVF